MPTISGGSSLAGAASGAGQVLYLDDTASDVSGYDTLALAPVTTTAEVQDSVAVTSAAEALIESYVSPTEWPNTTALPSGIWTGMVWARVNSTAGAICRVKCYLYSRTTGGVETLIGSGESAPLTANLSLYEIQIVAPDQLIAVTDRIVAKFYAVNSSGVSKTVTFTHNGTAHYTHIQTPLGAGSDPTAVHITGNESIAGNKTFTGLTVMDNTPAGSTTNVLDVWARTDATDGTEFKVRRLGAYIITKNTAGDKVATIGTNGSYVWINGNSSAGTLASDIKAYYNGNMDISSTGILNINAYTTNFTTDDVLTIGSTTTSAGGAWTFTGSIAASTVDLSTAATATAATSYFIETGSDGIIRPKTLANVKTELVTTAAVNAAIVSPTAVPSTGARQITVSTATPAAGDGADGDIWIVP